MSFKSLLGAEIGPEIGDTTCSGQGKLSSGSSGPRNKKQSFGSKYFGSSDCISSRSCRSVPPSHSVIRSRTKRILTRLLPFLFTFRTKRLDEPAARTCFVKYSLVLPGSKFLVVLANTESLTESRGSKCGCELVLTRPGSTVAANLYPDS